ncbi:helix-turn-helix transcriptional regulator [Nocardia sp. NPDC047038]|uniref:helix-turn-helix domain-containing protein n=1 Tax=Nocardia sp. NPDC047038 TaxID=3154338 RepID=UPI0033C127A7
MGKDDQPGSTLPRRQLGRALREAREGAGFTLERAAQLMEMGKTSVGRIEKGQNDKVKLRDVEAFGKLYGLGSERIEELKTLAQQTATKGWWHASHHLIAPVFKTYLGLESGVSDLSVYQSMIIPGLLQVGDYARCIERPYYADDTQEELERRVLLRLRRATILTRKYSPVAADFVVHESVLHTVVGSNAVMSAQARHMADMSTLPNVTLRILPFSAGFPVDEGPVQPYIILNFPLSSREFGTEPPVVYAETFTGSMFFEDSIDVKRYREIHGALQRAALDEKTSRDLLRQVARRYEQ